MFYSGPMILNDSIKFDAGASGNITLDGGLNSLSRHVGTAWRYPPAGIEDEDYARRIKVRPFDIDDAALGYYKNTKMITNIPLLTQPASSILRSSRDETLNEGIVRWVNLINEIK